MTELPALEPTLLPPGIRARHVEDVNGLTMHVLEAGYESAGRPCLLLLHGFPELAFSWRKVMLPLAAAGFHVVAPDQRGYGRTRGGDANVDAPLDSFSVLNLVRDALALVARLGRPHVEAVIGHDFGSPVAAWCALIRPDVFRSVVMMSAPFAGPPALPYGAAESAAGTSSGGDIHRELAALDPPRKHYQWYYSTPQANEDMWRCPQGIHDFLRAYYHVKSADWEGNIPFPLSGWNAAELAKLPRYYVMDQSQGMAATVTPHAPSSSAVAQCEWLPDEALRVYSAEYQRTGFQGGLQWYRYGTSERHNAELRLFSGRSIDVPACFIAGSSDWGIHQKPGALDAMQRSACTRFLGYHLVHGAGHWVQQEQPEETVRLLLDFLAPSGLRQ